MARRSKADRLTTGALSAFQTAVDDLLEAALLREEEAQAKKALAYSLLDEAGPLFEAATNDRNRATRLAELIG